MSKNMEPEYVTLKWIFDKFLESLAEDQGAINEFSVSEIKECRDAVKWFKESQAITRKARKAVCDAFGVNYEDYYEPPALTPKQAYLSDKFIIKKSKWRNFLEALTDRNYKDSENHV